MANRVSWTYKPPVGTPVNYGSPQAIGLIGVWNFSEGAGSTANDLSGKNNTGTLVNSPLWKSSSRGTVLQFNGSNNYVDIGSTSLYNFERTDKFSVTGWFNTTTLTPAGISQEINGKIAILTPFNGWGLQLFRRATSNSTAITVFLISNASVGSNYIEVNGGANQIVANQWMLATFTYDGSSTAAGVKIYLNGVLQTNTNVNDNLSGSIQSNIHTMIGLRDNTSPGQGFSGMLGEQRIYNRVLTAGDVMNIYTNPYDLYTRMPRRRNIAQQITATTNTKLSVSNSTKLNINQNTKLNLVSF